MFVHQQRAAAFATSSVSPVLRRTALSGPHFYNKGPVMSPFHHPFTSSSHHAYQYYTSALRFSPLPSMILENPVKVTGGVLGLLGILALLKYRGAIQRQLEILRQESWLFGAGVKMERVDTNEKRIDMTSNTVFGNLKLLQLDPEFQQTYEQQGWKLTTLGDYLSTLRHKGLPKQLDVPNIIQREIEAGLAAGLLKARGPQLGRALLPAVGTGFVQSKAQRLASTIATKWILSENSHMSSSNDKAGIPVPLMTLLAIADTNVKLSNSNSTTAVQEDDKHLPYSHLTAWTR